MQQLQKLSTNPLLSMDFGLIFHTFGVKDLPQLMISRKAFQ